MAKKQPASQPKPQPPAPGDKPVTFVYVYIEGETPNAAETKVIRSVFDARQKPGGLMRFFSRGQVNTLRPLRIRRVDQWSGTAFGNAELVYTDSAGIIEAYEKAGIPVKPISNPAKE